MPKLLLGLPRELVVPPPRTVFAARVLLLRVGVLVVLLAAGNTDCTPKDDATDSQLATQRKHSTPRGLGHGISLRRGHSNVYV